MNGKSNISVSEIIIQALLWIILICTPIFGVLAAGGNVQQGLKVCYQMSPNYVLWIGGFYINYVVFIPHLLMKHKRVAYVIALIVTYLILGNITGLVYKLIHGVEWTGTGNSIIDVSIQCGQFLLNMLLCLSAISFRVQQKNRILEKQLQEVKEVKENVEVENSDVKTDVVKTNNLIQDTKAAEPTFMFVKCEARQVKVNFDDILYVGALKDYVKIHLESQQRPLIALSTMKAIEEKLPKSRFCRVHRSYIVAMDKIESVERNRIAIGGEMIPVSETYQEVFAERLG